VAGGWRRLHNLYASRIVITMIKTKSIMRWVGSVARTGEMRNVYMFVVKSERKRTLGRPMCRWEGNIRTDGREGVWEGVDCIHLHQDRDKWRALVNTVMNLRAP
jgi:hypothetical protein